MALEMMLLIVAGLGVAVGCLLPNRWLPPLPNDKLMHFGSFALLSLLALNVAADRTEQLLWLGGLLVAGWLLECLQQLVPDRHFCWRDMAANAAGIATAALCFLLYGAFARGN